MSLAVTTTQKFPTSGLVGVNFHSVDDEPRVAPGTVAHGVAGRINIYLEAHEDRAADADVAIAASGLITADGTTHKFVAAIVAGQYGWAYAAA